MPMKSLDRLAEECGIEGEFRDVHGSMKATSAATKRALLAAMGIAAASDGEVSESLTMLERADWSAVLPTVCVVHLNAGRAELKLTLPRAYGTVTWRLELESGEKIADTVRFETLPLLAENDIEGRKLERRKLTLDVEIPPGYHRLVIDREHSSTLLIASPGRCWLPPQLAAGGRQWGVAAQVYSLRSATNWGIGDYSDLGKLTTLVAELGGDIVGINPLHALFLDDPDSASPYSPASRLLLNVLNIDVAAIPELATSPHARKIIEAPSFTDDLAQCRAMDWIDYQAIAKLKRPVLHALFVTFEASADTSRKRAFEKFRDAQSAGFTNACVFLALREYFVAENVELRDWRRWPAEYQQPTSPGVQRFVAEQSADVREILWLQWIADEQLERAATAARGMAIGLYKDVAVGADANGAESWSNPDAIVSKANIGAPPDLYNPRGQDWGLPPLHPRVLQEQAYAGFIELLRANMRHSGGLRIDHVMGLQHLYWIPAGSEPGEGAYVRYPLEDMLGVLALESERHHCLVVGEDLGTVPEGFRERMASANVLSYRVLFFEEDEVTGGYLPPERYPHLAVAVSGSHDLPTLRGWWDGTDLSIKERLNLFSSAQAAGAAREQRKLDRVKLLQALRREDLLDADKPAVIATLTHAVHAYLARSAAALVLAQLDDITQEAEPMNVPMTSTEYPNWRRRLSISLEHLLASSQLGDMAGEFRKTRRQASASD